MAVQPVLEFETDFAEKGEEMLRRAGRAQTLSLKSPYVRKLLAELPIDVQTILVDHTPVGPDQWHHTSGELGRSTDVIMEDTETESGAQWVISATQDAENPYGTQYAPFVILGHRTRSAGLSEKWHAGVAARPTPTSTNQGWVEADPYPERAMGEIELLLDTQLELVGRAIAEETVRFITSGEGL